MSRVLERIPSWVYALTVLACLLAWDLWPRRMNVVNPEALVTLESVIAFCESQDPAARDEVRCEDVRYAAEWCRTRGREMCRLDRFHDTLTGLGFQVPPLQGERR